MFDDYSTVTDEDFCNLAIHWRLLITDQHNVESDRIEIIRRIYATFSGWPASFFKRFYDFVVENHENVKKSADIVLFIKN